MSQTAGEAGKPTQEAVVNPSPQPLTNSQVNEALWKVIGRYDTYIGSTNTKAAFLIAFDTFVIGGIVLKWQDIQAAFGERPQAFIPAAVALIGAMVAALRSLYHTFQAISPFLKSPKRPTEYHSNIYFGEVAAFSEPEKYLEHLAKWDEAGLKKDLAFQAHVLAEGLVSKFDRIKRAIWWVIYVQLPALALATAILLIRIGADGLDKLAK